MAKKNFRVRYTWGRGEWSFKYYDSFDQAWQNELEGTPRKAYTPTGRPFLQRAIRTTIQERVGSTNQFKTITRQRAAAAGWA